MGRELDSLADVISFGIAPSILAFVWGLTVVNNRLGWIAAFTFTICGAMRLARFNIQAGDMKHFVGLPIPAAGGTIAAIVHFFVDPLVEPVESILMVATVFALSFLMVSTIRYSSLKQLTLGRKSHQTVLLIALLVAAIFYYLKWTLLTLGVVYSLSGILQKLYAMIRRKKTQEIQVTDPLGHH